MWWGDGVENCPNIPPRGSHLWVFTPMVDGALVLQSGSCQCIEVSIKLFGIVQRVGFDAFAHSALFTA